MYLLRVMRLYQKYHIYFFNKVLSLLSAKQSRRSSPRVEFSQSFGHFVSLNLYPYADIFGLILAMVEILN